MRLYEAVIPDNQPTGRLSAYLAQAFPMLPAWVIRDAFDKRDVKLDGVRVGDEALIRRGARVQVYTLFEQSLDVVYEDANVILVNKAAGLSMEADARGGDTLLSMLTHRADSAYTPRLTHRLDNTTSGLVVVAKTDDAEAELLRAFAAHEIEKRYVCLVKGTPKPVHAVCSAYLVKDALHARVRVVTHSSPEAKPICTEYTVIAPGDPSRVRVHLHTGRTHQIRAHMAFLSHPLLGDDKYGDRAYNKAHKCSRIALCADCLTFYTKGALSYLDGKAFTVDAPF